MKNTIYKSAVSISEGLNTSWVSPLIPQRTQQFIQEKVGDPKPHLYRFIFFLWMAVVIWFQPRMMMLLDMAYSPGSWIVLMGFILFIDFAWLYGIYNIGVVLFALYYKLFKKVETVSPSLALEADVPAVAILYTTCNDFLEESVLSCVNQNYANYHVYILDDSKDEQYKKQVDDFASRFPELVQVVRRPDRKAFKAGNMNHGLENFATEEPYFAIADADEILPTDFLSKLVPYLDQDENCGFVQANHRSNPNTTSALSQALGIGIDIHWEWYQPLRNDYGFVMFLGHGAILKRKCWEDIGGFPDIVSEDLGFAIHARELGYRGRFVEDVVCFEDFPDTVRSFRVRHMKWTRGTSEFLSKKFRWLLKAEKITWTEKFDILFPTLNLPLTLLYFLFMINANLALPYFFGTNQDVTLAFGGSEIIYPVMALDAGFNVIYGWDFFLITLLTFFGPVLCFILALFHKPIKLFKFLSHSTALYAALGPLSSIGVIAYMVSGKAIFLVTGGKQETGGGNQKSWNWDMIKSDYRRFINRSHPDSKIVQAFEIGSGLLFGLICIWMIQISFFGLCLAFMFLPIMHWLGWEHKLSRVMVYLPFLLILIGVGIASLSLIGMQPVFFGYGFHF